MQRNKGIDGFLTINNLLQPIPAKVQKDNENLLEAIKKLLQACDKNNYQKKIVIAKNNSDGFLNKDKNLVIVNDVNDFTNIQERL